MRPAKCNGERCGATISAHARFCPRCGKPVEVVGPPPPSQPPGAYRRPRRGFPILRAILLGWLIVFALKSLRNLTQMPSATIAPAVFTSPPVPQEMPQVDAAPDVSSLDSFVAWRADHKQSRQSRQQLEGRDIRWTGALKKSLISGHYELIQLDSQGKESVRLIPVTDDAKQDLRRLESGARVEIEGILMDEHSLHLFAVREVQ